MFWRPSKGQQGSVELMQIFNATDEPLTQQAKERNKGGRGRLRLCLIITNQQPGVK